MNHGAQQNESRDKGERNRPGCTSRRPADWSVEAPSASEAAVLSEKNVFGETPKTAGETPALPVTTEHPAQRGESDIVQSDPVQGVANAVMYEGYLLYPYRPSALKNRQRFNFGVLFPPAYCEKTQAGDSSFMQIECLVEAYDACAVEVRVRFLQIHDEETVEREIVSEVLKLEALAVSPRRIDFEFASTVREATARAMNDAAPGASPSPLNGERAGVRGGNVETLPSYRETLERTTPHPQSLSPLRAEGSENRVRGVIVISSAPIQGNVFKCSVHIANTSDCETAERDEALRASLISVHSILRVEQGAFVSMIDVPPHLASAREQCQNIGVWPVLVGREGDRSQMLASPIILYDYPKLAPQSSRDLFDGTEIDEILSLRIQTLTDDEKRELSRNAVAAALLKDVDGLRPDQLRQLHGAVYGTGKQEAFQPGDRVTIHPKRRADIFDIALAGRRATVCSVEKDFENNKYVCVTIDDDPGSDLGRDGKPGHRFFFGLDEVKRL